jgi:carboxylesterase
MRGASRSMRRFRGTERARGRRRDRAAGRFWPAALAAASVGLGLLAVLVRERVRARRLEGAVHARLRRGRGGIVVGAEPAVLLGSRTHAVLVVHGFGDTPQSVRELAESLHASGYTVVVPLLSGHGRSLAEFGGARAADWIEEVRGEAAALRRHYPHVALVGLSMGAALCSIVAAESDRLDALVLLAPYLSMPASVQRVAPLLRASAPVAPFRPSHVGPPSIHDPVARSRGLGFGVVSGRLLRELRLVTERARAALPRVTVPTLYIASRHDSRVPTADAARNWTLVRAPQRAIRWLDGSGHIMTVDYEKHTVFEEVEDWLHRHGGAPTSPPSPDAGAD